MTLINQYYYYYNIGLKGAVCILFFLLYCLFPPTKSMSDITSKTAFTLVATKWKKLAISGDTSDSDRWRPDGVCPVTRQLWDMFNIMQIKSDFRAQKWIGVKSVERTWSFAIQCQGKMQERLILAVSNCSIVYMSPCTYDGIRHADSEPDRLAFAFLLQINSCDGKEHSPFLVHL